jgi:hypothetical protein
MSPTVKLELPFGNDITVSRSCAGYYVARASLHPNDEQTILKIGDAKTCWKAAWSLFRKLATPARKACNCDACRM